MESIYLHHSGPLRDNVPSRPENRCGRYGFVHFSSIFMSTVGVEGAELALWAVVVQTSESVPRKCDLPK